MYFCVLQVFYMSFIDIVLGVLILFGVYKGFTKGLFVEAASLVGLIAGIYCAIHFSYVAGNYLSERISWEERYINLLAFAITFIVVVVLVGMAGKMLTKVADFAMLGSINKIAGAAFGGLKIAVILGAIMIFFYNTNNKLAFVDNDTLEESVLYEPIRNLGAFVFSKVFTDKERES